MIKTSFSRKVFLVCNYTILILLSLTCVLPFIHLFAVSFSSSAAVSAGWVTFWPVDFTLYSYEYAFRGGKFVRAFWESIKVVVLGVGINMIMMVLTAYPLSKSKDELLGRNIYMGFFVLTMLLNGGMIPTYLVVVKLGLKDSIWALILPGAVPVYNMIILMNFIRGLPRELEEAAKIDGANNLQVLWKVLLPLLKPSLATVGLFCMVSHWNSWYPGAIYMNDPSKYPLATYLHYLTKNFAELMDILNTDYDLLIMYMNEQTGKAAQLFLATFPVLVVYPFLQKYFTKGLTLGSVKG